MPYIIKGKILDDLGHPVQHAAVVKEIPAVAGSTTIADAVADADGSFQFVPLAMDSTIEISALGYVTQAYPVTEVPAEIRLEPALVIEGKTTPKKEDNTLLYVGVGIGVVALALLLRRNNKKTTAPAALQAPVVIRF